MNNTIDREKKVLRGKGETSCSAVSLTPTIITKTVNEVHLILPQHLQVYNTHIYKFNTTKVDKKASSITSYSLTRSLCNCSSCVVRIIKQCAVSFCSHFSNAKNLGRDFAFLFRPFSVIRLIASA
jgi:hypothetical protein